MIPLFRYIVYCFCLGVGGCSERETKMTHKNPKRTPKGPKSEQFILKFDIFCDFPTLCKVRKYKLQNDSFFFVSLDFEFLTTNKDIKIQCCICFESISFFMHCEAEMRRSLASQFLKRCAVVSTCTASVLIQSC